MSNKLEWFKAVVVGTMVVAGVIGGVVLIAWAAKHDAGEIADQREAIRIMARYEWLRSVEAWSERGEQGQHPMDFVPQALRDNDIAREAIANAKFDAVKFEAMRMEAGR